ncbi:Beta-L-arabinofuranosidase, GH127 [Mariniphaga anaerophila]|uniref:Beta-L-arabinofuranosidase, GH127 n=1 Tax=Mariniphaga anaerophila TaxID=1484053 RepID=A0A1M5AJK4_9BACT|nr:beta-L-arabinofuranosidase domain-containing protein [Mariniphaga anaerophila]SHF30458.1 Beta-L-arabinofuranosidase, GH127 [Mariniphaga anaerophila]
MKRFSLAIVILVIIASCSNKEKFPEYVTLPVSQNGVKFSAETKGLIKTGVAEFGNPGARFDELDSLLAFQQMYLKKDKRFDFLKLQSFWQKAKEDPQLENIQGETAKQWFRSTGFLFQLTGEMQYPREMERLARSGIFSDSEELDSLITPYVFTKDVDHVSVNFFLPSEISYEHSLGGAVSIKQVTNFPESGSVRLNFSMEIKRYIEVFVRIPVWAEGASVMVKGVKYFSHPGSYCIIAKKWKEGDVVEIEFPTEKIPEYLKN